MSLYLQTWCATDPSNICNPCACPWEFRAGFEDAVSLNFGTAVSQTACPVPFGIALSSGSGTTPDPQPGQQEPDISGVIYIGIGGAFVDNRPGNIPSSRLTYNGQDIFTFQPQIVDWGIGPGEPYTAEDHSSHTFFRFNGYGIVTLSGIRVPAAQQSLVGQVLFDGVCFYDGPYPEGDVSNLAVRGVSGGFSSPAPTELGGTIMTNSIVVGPPNYLFFQNPHT
jgi:hypothetical protein